MSMNYGPRDEMSVYAQYKYAFIRKFYKDKNVDAIKILIITLVASE